MSVWVPVSEPTRSKMIGVHLAAYETLSMVGQRGWGLHELACRLGIRKDTIRRKLYGSCPPPLPTSTAGL